MALFTFHCTDRGQPFRNIYRNRPFELFINDKNVHGSHKKPDKENSGESCYYRREKFNIECFHYYLPDSLHFASINSNIPAIV
jgi:hypothetical protein